MRRVTSAVLAALTMSAAAGAQTATGAPATDSAAVARAAWARANAMLRTGDTSGARAQLDRAATAWPGQPVYAWALARLAAASRDTMGALVALRRVSDLGLGRDLMSDSLIASMRAATGFAEAQAAHDRHRSTIARGTVLRELPDSTLWPEGLDHDARTGAFYVAGIRSRTIVRVDRDGTTRPLWTGARPGVGAMLGVRVDPTRRLLWATTSGIKQMLGFQPADSSISALLQLDPRTGAVRRRWDLPIVRGGHVLGDLALGPRGDVFFTDSNEPVLYRLRPGADTLETLRHPLFRSLQGVAATPDGRFLYLADYSHGLLRVDLRDRSVTPLTHAATTTTLGCDGIVLHRGAIIAVQNGVVPARVVRFALDRSGIAIVSAEVLDRNPALAPEPTIGTIAGNRFVYVANSSWDAFDGEGRLLPTGRLTRPRLVAVPLPR